MPQGVSPVGLPGFEPGTSSLSGMITGSTQAWQKPAISHAQQRILPLIVSCHFALFCVLLCTRCARGQLRNDSTEAANALGVAASDSSADVPLSSTLEFGRYCSDLVICVTAIHEVRLAA